MNHNSGIVLQKWHGLGNDFLMLDKTIESNKVFNYNQIPSLANRKTGIGCDQFVVFDWCNDKILVEFFNQDGTKSSMCGNATRCVAQYWYNKHVTQNNVTIQTTDGRNLICNINNDSVSVDMGTANQVLQNDDGIFVDIGNPHLIIFDFDGNIEKMEYFGSQMQAKYHQTKGINVNFATIVDNDLIELQTYERGVGFTLACGTGACATAIAHNFRTSHKTMECKIRMHGGELLISTLPNNHFVMTGSATYICTIVF